VIGRRFGRAGGLFRSKVEKGQFDTLEFIDPAASKARPEHLKEWRRPI